MNVKAEIVGDVLRIEIDCSGAAREAAKDSKSGKTRILATTSGFESVGDIKINLNATIDK